MTQEQIQTNLLIFHSKAGHRQEVQLLITKGTPLNTPYDHIDKGTALHYTNDPQVLQSLLEAGADPNATDFYGRTPLHTARSAWKTKALLEAGARKDLTDLSGHTPFYHQSVLPEHAQKIAILKLLHN